MNPRFSHSLFSVVTAATLGVACGCQSPKASSSLSAETRVIAASGDYTDSLVAVATIAPEQSAERPLVRLSGFDRSSDGSFLVGDVSEGRVTRFDARGKTLAFIGRKGSGPGEFDQPRFPRIATNGRIVVADGAHRTLQVFDSSGALQRSHSISELGFVTGFQILDDDRYIFSVLPAVGDSVLVLTDSLGRPVRRFLSIAQTRPGGQPPHTVWENVRQPAFAIRNDTAFVVVTLSDSLWILDLRSGHVASTRLSIPGYVAPALPEKFAPGPRGLSEWTNSYHMAVTIFATDGSIYIPFVRGVLNYGDPTILVQRRSNGAWLAFNTTQPLLHASRGVVTVIANPGGDTVSLRTFAER